MAAIDKIYLPSYEEYIQFRDWLKLQPIKEDISLYEQFYNKFAKEHQAERISDFCLAQRYMLYGKELNFWRTVETSVNSLNYFTDGTCSDEYFIVEGYLKYMDK